MASSPFMVHDTTRHEGIEASPLTLTGVVRDADCHCQILAGIARFLMRRAARTGDD